MNVIVVEDNRRLSNILRQGLVEDGHQVVVAQRGDEGRDLLFASPFDVAVLDVMLPGLDGFSILLELLMRRPNQVVTRNQLREVAWPHDADVSDSSVDFYMHSLRSKIDIKGTGSLIRTVRSL